MILYCTGIDVSRDNGAGINERGFVRQAASSKVVNCLLPSPAFPDTYHDPRHTYVSGHFGRWWRMPLFMLKAWIRLRQCTRQTSVAAFVTRQGPQSFVLYLLARRYRIPVFLKSYTGRVPYETMSWRDVIRAGRRGDMKIVNSRISHLIIGRFHKSFMKQVHFIDCPSPECCVYIRQKHSMADKRIEVVPNGADTDFYRPLDPQPVRTNLGIPPDAFVIGYAGAMGGEARYVDFLIDELISLTHKANVYGLLLGSGQAIDKYRQRVRSAACENKIFLPGFIPNREVPQWISAMSLAADMTAVHLSDSHIASFSQKIPQYLSCGTPVVAWALPDNRFISSNDLGFLVPFLESKCFGQIIRDNMSDIRSVAMRERCRTYALKSLSLDAVNNQRIKCWQDVLRSHSYPVGI